MAPASGQDSTINAALPPARVKTHKHRGTEGFTRPPAHPPKEPLMNIPTYVATSTPTHSAVLGLLRQLAAAAALGCAVLYGVAFADSPLAHNAAHDVRHVTVKPCH